MTQPPALCKWHSFQQWQVPINGGLHNNVYQSPHGSISSGKVSALTEKPAINDTTSTIVPVTQLLAIPWYQSVAKSPSVTVFSNDNTALVWCLSDPFADSRLQALTTVFCFRWHRWQNHHQWHMTSACWAPTHAPHRKRRPPTLALPEPVELPLWESSLWWSSVTGYLSPCCEGQRVEKGFQSSIYRVLVLPLSSR